ncbi:hypothetical protein [Herbaspirillum sp. NPDC087042]|uniref:hypothetical protein n=1 Tax=Herbaspirillum sp. NPDC087042 TaxID=3364004 RepID=UPI0038253279
MKKGRPMHVAAHPNGLHGREETANSAAVFDTGKHGLQHFLLQNLIIQIIYSIKPFWRSMRHFPVQTASSSSVVQQRGSYDPA